MCIRDSVITDETREKLEALARTEKAFSGSRMLIMLGNNIVYSFIMIMIFVLAKFITPLVYNNLKKFAILVGGTVTTFLLYDLAWKIDFRFIPIACGIVLIQLLLGTNSAFVLLASCIILSSVLFPNNAAPTVITITGGILTLYGTSRIQMLSDIYAPILFALAGYVGVVLGIDLLNFKGAHELLKSLSVTGVSSVSFVFIGLGLATLFGKLLRIATKLTLVEFADPTRKILREFAVRAPGSYNHSILVANLAETAARAIGANGLLARVGGYYHDIGKLKHPEYYIENQRGKKNPLDKLTPRLKRVVLRSHVLEGVKIARKEGLPEDVVDIIREHHGTILMASIYKKGEPESDYRYPGPIPSSKESAIVMLADSIEAKLRSLEDYSIHKLTWVIESIINARIKEGQLANSGLTITDLEKIKESFLPILIGIVHPRIKYPGE